MAEPSLAPSTESAERWRRTYQEAVEADPRPAAEPFGPVVMLNPLDAAGRGTLPGHTTRTRRRRDDQIEARSVWTVEGPAVITQCRVRLVQTGEVWIEPLDYGIADVAAGVRTPVMVRVWWRA